VAGTMDRVVEFDKDDATFTLQRRSGNPSGFIPEFV
jgi:hypothetical protein